MCEEEREELWLEGGGVRFVYTDDYVDSILAKVAELQSSHDALEAKLAKYQKLKPVAYSVTCDGIYTGNVFGQKQTAEHKMQILDESWPENSRKVVPLYALEK